MKKQAGKKRIRTIKIRGRTVCKPVSQSQGYIFITLFFLSLSSLEKKMRKSPCKLPNSLLSYLLSSSESKYYGTCYSEGSSGLLKDYATREFNAFLWISLVTITALLLGKVFKLFRLWSKARRIAGPPCTSFFGHNNFGSRGNFIGQWSVIDVFIDVFFVFVWFSFWLPGKWKRTCKLIRIHEVNSVNVCMCWSLIWFHRKWSEIYSFFRI